MYKVTWNEKSDEFKHCFAICNAESMFSLYWNLTVNQNPKTDGCGATDVTVWDLSGYKIDMKKGSGEWLSCGEYTHK